MYLAFVPPSLIVNGIMHVVESVDDDGRQIESNQS